MENRKKDRYRQGEGMRKDNGSSLSTNWNNLVQSCWFFKSNKKLYFSGDWNYLNTKKILIRSLKITYIFFLNIFYCEAKPRIKQWNHVLCTEKKKTKNSSDVKTDSETLYKYVLTLNCSRFAFLLFFGIHLNHQLNKIFHWLCVPRSVNLIGEY